MRQRRSFFLVTAALFGYAFLYIPLAIVVMFSFNNSKLVTVWTGFSTQWYGALLANDRLIKSLWVSLEIATLSATLAVILGTLAALALVRIGKFRGRLFFRGLLNVPFVLPDIITGLALLLLFVTLHKLISWPVRGAITITIAHTTLSMAYVTAIVQSRLKDYYYSLDEAAMDLGARPLKVFFLITLPTIAPALVSGWLLSFALSLDDVVIASFVSGPEATTLPMVIFSSIRLGVTPQINALATLIILSVALAITCATVIMNRQKRSA